jgi:hypothetical protein
MAKFRRLGSPSAGLPSDTVLLGRATNAWAIGASADDVSTLGGMVRSMGSTTDALLAGMVRTN